MKAGAKVAAIAFAAGLLTATAGFAWYEHQDQPHMTAALAALQSADQHLKEAQHNKGGHRQKAQDATDGRDERPMLSLWRSAERGARCPGMRLAR